MYTTEPATATCANPTPPLDEVAYSPEATPNGRGKTSNNESDALPEKIIPYLTPDNTRVKYTASKWGLLCGCSAVEVIVDEKNSCLRAQRGQISCCERAPGIHTADIFIGRRQKEVGRVSNQLSGSGQLRAIDREQGSLLA